MVKLLGITAVGKAIRHNTIGKAIRHNTIGKANKQVLGIMAIVNRKRR